jgi:hypothetical protein
MENTLSRKCRTSDQKWLKKKMEQKEYNETLTYVLLSQKSGFKYKL